MSVLWGYSLHNGKVTLVLRVCLLLGLTDIELSGTKSSARFVYQFLQSSVFCMVLAWELEAKEQC